MAGIETHVLSLTLAGRSLTLPADRIGEGPPALLLPALSSIATREEMRPLAMRLAARHRCLVPDWPGFGAQPRARVPLSPDTLHAFLDALLDQAPGPYALGVAAGHAAGYLVAAASRHRDGPGIPATVSVGLAAGGGDLPDLLSAADRALYRAKAAGRNRLEVAAA